MRIVSASSAILEASGRAASWKTSCITDPAKHATHDETTEMEKKMTDQISRRGALGAGALLGAAAIAPTRAQAQTAQPTAADTLAKVKAAGTLLAGVRNDFPPIGSIDTSGKPVGFGPDLAEAFAKKLGVKAEFV